MADLAGLYLFAEAESCVTGEVGCGAVYFPNTTFSWVTLVVNWDGEALELELACDAPPCQHWFEFEMEQVGLRDILGAPPGFHPLDMISWMMSLGIAPGIPFMVEMEYRTYRDYWGEYDCAVDWKLMARDVNLAEHWKAWLDYFREDATTLPPNAPWRHEINQMFGGAL